MGYLPHQPAIRIDGAGLPTFVAAARTVGLVPCVRRQAHHITGSAENPVMPRLLFDFNDAGAVQGWVAIDDRVMGGVSRSRLRHDLRGHAVFEGEVSLERNGGFASVRCSPGERGAPGAAACVLEVRGADKQFKLSLLTDDGVDSLNYQASFTPAEGDWQTLRLPIAAFRAHFRGRDVPGAPALDPARIRQVGLVIGARQEGRFALAIRRIGLA